MTDVYEIWAVLVTTDTAVSTFAGAGTGLPVFFGAKERAEQHAASVLRVNPTWNAKAVLCNVTVAVKPEDIRKNKEKK